MLAASSRKQIATAGRLGSGPALGPQFRVSRAPRVRDENFPEFGTPVADGPCSIKV